MTASPVSTWFCRGAVLRGMELDLADLGHRGAALQSLPAIVQPTARPCEPKLRQCGRKLWEQRRPHQRTGIRPSHVSHSCHRRGYRCSVGAGCVIVAIAKIRSLQAAGAAAAAESNRLQAAA